MKNDGCIEKLAFRAHDEYVKRVNEPFAERLKAVRNLLENSLGFHSAVEDRLDDARQFAREGDLATAEQLVLDAIVAFKEANYAPPYQRQRGN